MFLKVWGALGMLDSYWRNAETYGVMANAMFSSSGA